MISIEVNMVQVNESNDSDNDKAQSTKPEVNAETAEANGEKQKVTLEFPYSELIRAQVPGAFELVEKLATDWKHEGDFTDLGIKHPVAGIVASQALQKAKSVEKKLEEKGIFSIAKLGLEIAKAQVENIKSKIQK